MGGGAAGACDATNNGRHLGFYQPKTAKNSNFFSFT